MHVQERRRLFRILSMSSGWSYAGIFVIASPFRGVAKEYVKFQIACRNRIFRIPLKCRVSNGPLSSVSRGWGPGPLVYLIPTLRTLSASSMSPLGGITRVSLIPESTVGTSLSNSVLSTLEMKAAC